MGSGRHLCQPLPVIDKYFRSETIEKQQAYERTRRKRESLDGRDIINEGTAGTDSLSKEYKIPGRARRERRPVKGYFDTQEGTVGWS